MSKDYRAYAAKEITPTMEAFAEWLRAETGVDVDLKSVALAGSLRMEFQRSDFWKAHEDNYKANIEANREAKAVAAADRAKERLQKAQDAVKAAEAKAKEAIAAAKAKADALTAEAGDKAA